MNVLRGRCLHCSECSSWIGLIHILCLVGLASALVPVSRHVTVQAVPGTDVVIQLLPYDRQSLTISKTTIEILPSTGQLYQLSQVYAVHGYDPKVGSQITANGTDVYSLASNRVIFRTPLGFTRTTMKYSATNSNGKSSYYGIVYITVDGVAVQSDFTIDNEGWLIVYDAVASPSWSATSVGHLNHYIYSTSIPYVLNSANRARWSFQAPAKFYGNFARAYNGYLQFWMTSFAGDFTANVRPNPKRFVELTCATCANGAGISLVQRNITYLGDTRFFKFQLNELGSNQWLKDPKDVFQTTWSSPTYYEFFQVLSNLTKIAIYPDSTYGQESVALDNVQLVLGLTDVNVTAYP